MNKDGKRFTTGQRGCGSEYGVKPRIASSASDLLGGGAVIGDEVCLIHAEMRSSRLIGEVEDEKLDRYATNAATHLEWVDSLVNEMAKEFRPCALLAVGRIPNTRFSGLVVSARAQGGVSTRCQRVPCGALVPVTTGQSSSRCAGDRVGKAHTYEPSTNASAALRTFS